MKKPTIGMFRAAVCLTGGLLAAAALPQTDARAAGIPTLHLESLERTAPGGWVTVESSGDEKAGRVVIERVVWPLFYLHWRPLAGKGGVGDKLTVAEAEKTVAGLWEGLVFDVPPAGKKVSLPAHEAVTIEGTTWKGGWKSRYFVWACPESGRLFIADTNASLQVGVPPALLDLMADMTRTVRCHENGKIDEFPSLTKRRLIEETDISYGLPYTWFPIAGFRVQRTFAAGDFAANRNPAATKTLGQDLVLELDSLRRLTVSWEPAPDAAMTFEGLVERVHGFWKDVAKNLMPGVTRVANDVWIMEGLVQVPKPTPVPPGRYQKFRAWVWRNDGKSYLAVGQLGGIRFGQRSMTEIQEIADPMLEELFQAIDY